MLYHLFELAYLLAIGVVKLLETVVIFKHHALVYLVQISLVWLLRSIHHQLMLIKLNVGGHLLCLPCLAFLL